MDSTLALIIYYVLQVVFFLKNVKKFNETDNPPRLINSACYIITRGVSAPSLVKISLFIKSWEIYSPHSQ